MLDRNFIAMLRCPASGSPLALLDKHRLRLANRRAETGELRHVDGRVVDRPMEAALVTRDGATVYPVRDGIPILLLDEAIPSDQFGEAAAADAMAPNETP